MFAISPTDNNWFNYLKQNELNSFVNFWTPTPWNVRRLSSGDRLYFMLKAPIRKIGGFGEFYEYKNMSSDEAWEEFGHRNGRYSKLELSTIIRNYVAKNSNLGQVSIDTHDIGCIVLKNCEFWDTDKFLEVENYNISFERSIVTLKYFDQLDPFTETRGQASSFVPLNQPRIPDQAMRNIRNGQGGFKGKMLRAYNNKCCISGETIPELLEAAHIQKYINSNSHHVQNGLILRVDLHKLYDNGLLFIDSDFVVHLSSVVEAEFYQQYNQKKISLPMFEFDYPSSTALEMRRGEFRK